MKNILITSGSGEDELEFSRMLELELAEKGCRIISSDRGEPYTHIFVSHICDAEKIRKTAGKGPEIRVICCGYEANGQLPHGAVFIERPFDVSRFIENIISSDSAEVRHPDTAADGIVIDRNTRTVSFRGEHISVTDKEFAVLCCLEEKCGSPVSRQDIYSAVWGKEKSPDTNVVDVNIRYLRKKIDEKFGCRVILTVRGKGYMLK